MCPNNKDIANVIENNVISNNSYKHRDVINAKKILGPDIESLKGKIVWKKSRLPRENAIIDIPPSIVE